MRVGGEGRFARISSGNWRLFAGELQLPEEWVLDQLLLMIEHLPKALAEACASTDLVGVADDTLFRLQERVGEWCRTARAAT